jgi:hypothetical protein
MTKRKMTDAALVQQFGRDSSAEIDLIKQAIADLEGSTTLFRVTGTDIKTNGDEAPSFVTLRIDPPDEAAMRRYAATLEAGHGNHHVN